MNRAYNYPARLNCVSEYAGEINDVPGHNQSWSEIDEGLGGPHPTGQGLINRVIFDLTWANRDQIQHEMLLDPKVGRKGWEKFEAKVYAHYASIAHAAFSIRRHGKLTKDLLEEPLARLQHRNERVDHITPAKYSRRVEMRVRQYVVRSDDDDVVIIDTTPLA